MMGRHGRAPFVEPVRTCVFCPAKRRWHARAGRFTPFHGRVAASIPGVMPVLELDPRIDPGIGISPDRFRGGPLQLTGLPESGERPLPGQCLSGAVPDRRVEPGGDEAEVPPSPRLRG